MLPDLTNPLLNVGYGSQDPFGMVPHPVTPTPLSMPAAPAPPAFSIPTSMDQFSIDANPSGSQPFENSFGFDQLPHSYQAGETNLPQIPTPDLNSTTAPYYDKFFPNESMTALKNYMASQMPGAADKALASGGIYSSGIGSLAANNAMNYLEGATGNMTSQQALASDLANLYGAGEANDLTQGQSFGVGGIAKLSPQLSGPKPFLDANGNPMTSPYGVFQEMNNPAYNAETNPNVPQYGFVGNSPYDYNGQPGAEQIQFASPGYWYNPSAPPDTTKMPWLKQ